MCYTLHRFKSPKKKKKKTKWKKKASDERRKKRCRSQPIARNPNLLFESDEEEEEGFEGDLDLKLKAESFESQGNQLAEDGKYREALQKWEVAIALMPEKAKLHEQKAQVFLDIGDAWSGLKAASRATELEPLWAEAWITLGRAQLNYGEPDLAIKSFDRALAIKRDHEEALADRETASLLVKRRKQLHSSDLNINQIRFKVGGKVECSSSPTLLYGDNGESEE